MQGSEERTSNPLETGVKKGWAAMWVPGTEPGSSTTAASALNLWAVFPLSSKHLKDEVSKGHASAEADLTWPADQNQDYRGIKIRNPYTILCKVMDPVDLCGAPHPCPRRPWHCLCSSAQEVVADGWIGCGYRLHDHTAKDTSDAIFRTYSYPTLTSGRSQCFPGLSGIHQPYYKNPH